MDSDKDIQHLRAYTCGPMSGIAGHNFPAFAKAKKKLEAQGIEVLSPAENFNGAVIDALRHLYMARDIEQVLRADMVVVLPDWENSDGAFAEVMTARQAGRPVLHLENLNEITETEFRQAIQNLAMRYPLNPFTAVEQDVVSKGA